MQAEHDLYLVDPTDWNVRMNTETLQPSRPAASGGLIDLGLSVLESRWSLFVGAILVFWTVCPAPERGFSQTSKQGEATSVEVVSTMLPNGVQQIVVIDTEQKSMAVYQVEPAQGKIQLRSVRRLIWDLQMEEFNGQTPLPSELRKVQP